MTTNSQAIVEYLAEAGVRYAYTVPGESFLGLLDAFDASPDVDLTSTRHEGGASFMAAGSAEVSGQPAVVLGSRGPGAANLSIGVHAAMQDSTPMIVLLGQVPTHFLGREAFQEVDLEAMFTPLAKWCATASVQREVLPLIREAHHKSVSGRPGPVVVVLPTDLLDEGTLLDDGGLTFQPEEPLPGEAAEDLVAPESDLLFQCGSALAQATSPIFVLGRGCPPNNAAVIEAAERFGAGVYVAFRCQDRFPVAHPNFLGHLGLGVPAEICDPLRHADLVVTFGLRWDEVTSQEFSLPSRETHQFAIGTFPASGEHPWIESDVERATVGLLIDAPETPRQREWSGPHDHLMKWMTVDQGIESPTDSVHPARVVAILRELLPDDSVVTNDAGNFAAFLHRYWTFGPGVGQLGSLSGAMGYAIPAAIASAQHQPQRQAVAVVGDGGTLMTGNELEVAARRGWNPIVVVFQNHIYGTIAMHQLKATGRSAAIEIGDVDFEAWGTGLGARAYTVHREDDFRAALKDALIHSGPSVVTVRTDPKVISPTMTLDEPLT
ncbi:acetolactate synthase large subunit family protein [Arthrobacter pigmenti]